LNGLRQKIKESDAILKNIMRIKRLQLPRKKNLT